VYGFSFSIEVIKALAFY